MVRILHPVPTPAPPKSPSYHNHKLRIPQVRVLQALCQLLPESGLTRQALSDIIGNKTGVVVGRAVGYSDPVKRAAFEQTKDGGGSPGKPCPSLLTLGFVREREVDVDGIADTQVIATAAGRSAFLALGKVNLPPVKERQVATDLDASQS